jgi:hypothetical protein
MDERRRRVALVATCITISLVLVGAAVRSLWGYTPAHVGVVVLLPIHSDYARSIGRPDDALTPPVQSSAGMRRARIAAAEFSVRMIVSGGFRQYLVSELEDAARRSPGENGVGTAEHTAILDGALRVRRLSRRNVVEISFSHPDPVIASSIVDAAARSAQSYVRQRLTDTSNNSLTMLQAFESEARNPEKAILAEAIGRERLRQQLLIAEEHFFLRRLGDVIVKPSRAPGEVPLAWLAGIGHGVLLAAFTSMALWTIFGSPVSRPATEPGWRMRSAAQWSAWLALVLLCGTLAIDAVTGAMILAAGVDMKLSLLFKLVLVLMMICGLAIIRRTQAVLIGLMFFVFATGATYSYVGGGTIDALVTDYAYAMKLLLPLLACCWIIAVEQWFPGTLDRWLPYILGINACIFLLSMLAGAGGFGFSTYDDADSEGVGSSGLFFAGNEVSGVYILLAGVVLNWAWQRSTWLYLPVSAMLLLLGLLLATKVAMLAGFLLCILVPIINERERMFRFSWLKVAIIGGGLLAAGAVWITMRDSVIAQSVFARFESALLTQGIVGFLLSGRDVFVADFARVMDHAYTPLHWAFGMGTGGLAEHLGKVSSEIDPIDALAWFGLPGMMAGFLIHGSFLMAAWRGVFHSSASLAPAVLCIALLLFGAALVAGHIWFSGMLGALLGILVGAVVAAKPRSVSDANPRSVGPARHERRISLRDTA